MRELAVRGAHVAALWGLAAAGPVFDLLGSHPEFFSARGSPTRDIVIFALGVALVPPLALTALEWLAGLVSRTLAWTLHLAYVVVLTAAIVLQLVPMDAWLPGVTLALIAGGAAAALYARASAMRSVLNVLTPAPLVFAGVFLLLSDVSPLVVGDDREAQAAGAVVNAPLVVVLLDELPVQSLMRANGRIDARSYPNFARLAAHSTWYRNTASVDQDTPYAVPAVLDGRLPRQELLPVAADHPQNLFSLLAGRYELHVREDATAMCAPRLCGPLADGGLGTRLRSLWHDAGLVYAHEVVPDRLEDDLPAVARTWRRFVALEDPTAAVAATRRLRRESKRHRFLRLHANLAGGRARRFERFVDEIEGGARPRLHFLHILLPHVPFRYLPSGTRYRNSPREALPGLDSRPGYGIPFLVRQAYQRHLLQLMATDRLLGKLLDRLHQVDLYDHAVVALVADHGISFRLGHDRRLVRAANIEDIAPVPFFLKLPGQRRGRISDKPLRTVDVLPTLADAIGLRIPWRVDGRSALEPTVPAQRRRRIISKKFRHIYLVDTPAYEAERRAALARKLRLFRGGLERIGPASDLIGRSVARVPVLPARAERAVIGGAGRYRDVHLARGIVPGQLVGRITGGRVGGGRVIAVALNGRIAATGRTFTLPGAHAEQFSLLIPERFFREGANPLRLLLADQGTGAAGEKIRGWFRVPPR